MPCGLDRVALHDCGGGEADTGEQDDTNQDPACTHKVPLVDEDSVIEEENGKLGAVDGQLVEYLDDKKILIEDRDELCTWDLSGTREIDGLAFKASAAW